MFNFRLSKMFFFCFLVILSCISSKAQAAQCDQNPQPAICKYIYNESGVLEARLKEIADESNVAWLVDLNNKYGFPATQNGEKIYAMRITSAGPGGANPFDQNGRLKRAVLVDALHHANEVIGTEVALDMIEYLTTEYTSGDPDVTTWVDNLDIWIVPMVNPDGANYAYIVDQNWRKNRTPLKPTAGGSACEPCDPAAETCEYGVDLNRNYPFTWGACNNESTCDSSTYPGTGPGSEVETQIMDRLLERERPVFYLSYHSGFLIKSILYPYGCSDWTNVEKDTFEEIASELQTALGGASVFDVAEISDYYPNSGSSLDHAYAEYGTFPFAIEVSANRIPDYDDQRDAIVQEQRSAWQFFLERSLNGPMVLGNVEGYTVGIFGYPDIFKEDLRSNITMSGINFPNGENVRTTDYYGTFAWPIRQSTLWSLLNVSSDNFFDETIAIGTDDPTTIELEANNCHNLYFEHTACTNPDNAEALINEYTRWRERAIQEGKKLRVPVAIHVLRRDDGTGSDDISVIDSLMEEKIAEVNRIFSGLDPEDPDTRIEFYKKSISSVDNTQYYEDPNFGLAKARELTANFNDPKALNVYNIPQDWYVPGANFGTQPYLCSQGTYFSGLFGAVARKWGHEFGHYLNLFHPSDLFGDPNNMSDCRQYGDFICDDSSTSIMTSNLAAKSFTQEQAARMVCVLAEVRPELDPDEDGLYYGDDNCPLDTNVDQTDADGDGQGDPCDVPFIDSISLGYGNVVIITGDDLTGVNQVTFNGTPASGILLISDTLLYAVIPAAATSGSVTATTEWGTTSNPVNYNF